MSDRQVYADLEQMIQTMDDGAARGPAIPVDVFIHEALRLHSWALKDREALEGAGMDWQLVEDLRTRAGALRHAQGVWNNERFGSEKTQRLWLERSAQAFDLRDSLLHAFRFAFRKSPDLQRLLAIIAQGKSTVDKLQGLKDLAVAGRRHSRLLEDINFDPALLDHSENLAEDTGRLFAEVRNDRGACRQAKLNRDKIATLLKETVDEVRAYGQYVFWREPRRKAGYTSDYYRAKKQAAAEAAAARQAGKPAESGPPAGPAPGSG